MKKERRIEIWKAAISAIDLTSKDHGIQATNFCNYTEITAKEEITKNEKNFW